jgi:hypothetical protein
MGEITAEDQSDIANDEFGANERLPRVLMSHDFLRNGSDDKNPRNISETYLFI